MVCELMYIFISEIVTARTERFFNSEEWISKFIVKCSEMLTIINCNKECKYSAWYETILGDGNDDGFCPFL
ncbi:hypothetical protein OWV82_020955 [Melia azedarach]|uniref:Uncharacterized protein n=1 Tax=Melia azedarach TaxID=155640 RepID=A0ACC1X7X6_MELAZ|nr:hypothetical protein OWV82_020955 [Melia azedarach]